MKLRRTYVSLLAGIGYLLLQGLPLGAQDSLRLQPSDGRIILRENCENIALVAGLHQGSYTFIELGMALQQEHNSLCAFGSYTRALSLSAEYNPFQNRAGLCFTAWASGLGVLSWGCNLNTYSDFHSATLGMKPFIGIGPGTFNLCYGYNFQFMNPDRISGLNKHTLSLRASFALFERCR